MKVDYFNMDEEGNMVVRHVELPDHLLTKTYATAMLAKFDDPQDAYEAMRIEREAAMVDVDPVVK
jgi:hypothetical protein